MVLIHLKVVFFLIELHQVSSEQGKLETVQAVMAVNNLSGFSTRSGCEWFLSSRSNRKQADFDRQVPLERSVIGIVPAEKTDCLK